MHLKIPLAHSCHRILMSISETEIKRKNFIHDKKKNNFFHRIFISFVHCIEKFSVHRGKVNWRKEDYMNNYKIFIAVNRFADIFKHPDQLKYNKSESVITLQHSEICFTTKFH